MQFPSIATANRSIEGLGVGRMKSGLCRMNSHFSAFSGMPGAAQGEA